ncbi:MAG: SagB/ThcOx family dehydrogenase [Bacteroidales bacterium]|jgi:hypothetical protein|nr:SagB/ThcOx family dehydrogenase [Bacteroidales bacterium]
MKNYFLIITIFASILISCQGNKSEQKTDDSESKAVCPTDVNDNLPMEITSFDTIKLLTPKTKFGKTLMEAMWLRKTSREYSEKMLSLRQLSDLMWVTNGINRPDDATRNRTVPSAMAKYPIQTYAVLANGIYFYNPEQNLLIPYLEGDFREQTGGQPFVGTAPLNIVLFADYSVYEDPNRQMDDIKKLWFAALDAAHSCQNIYLYCASENLSTVERAMAPENICEIFKLNENHHFIIAQTVGFPK